MAELTFVTLDHVQTPAERDHRSVLQISSTIVSNYGIDVPHSIFCQS